MLVEQCWMVCCPDEVELFKAGLGLGFIEIFFRIIILQVCVEINLAETRWQISKSGLLSSSASPKYFQTFEVVPGLYFSLSGVVSGMFGCGLASRAVDGDEEETTRVAIPEHAPLHIICIVILTRSLTHPFPFNEAFNLWWFRTNDASFGVVPACHSSSILYPLLVPW